MSADNGHYVGVCVDQPEKYGIFYYFASSTYYDEWYTSENAVEVCSNPITAILRALKIERDSHTEYGVSVSEVTLHAAELTMEEYLRR